MRKHFFLAAGFLIVLGSASVAGSAYKSPYPWYSVVPSLLAIYLSLAVGRLPIAFGAALVSGCLLLVCSGGNASLLQFLSKASQEVSSWPAIHIVSFVGWIMAMISVLRVSRAIEGILSFITPYASNRRRATLSSMMMGMLIFFDDYSNTIIVGSTSRPLTDRYRVSREKLSFIVDATAAPLAGLVLISTWVGFEALQVEEAARALGETTISGFAVLIEAIPYRLYCIGMLVFTFLVVLTQRDFGPMFLAEKRALEDGALLMEGERPLTSVIHHSGELCSHARERASCAIIPILGLIVSVLLGLWIDGGGALDSTAILSPSVWLMVLSRSESNILVLHCCSFFSAMLACACAIWLAQAKPLTIFWAFLGGLKGALLPAVILLLAIGLKELCVALQTGAFIANLANHSFSPIFLPAISFLLSAITAFSIGSSWGTMGILIPVVLPTAFALEGSFGILCIISFASVLDGAILGDHCSPLSDTTILSSLASECNHQAHVRTQLPYALYVGLVVALPGYLLAAARMSPELYVPGLLILLGFIFFLISKPLPLSSVLSQKDR